MSLIYVIRHGQSVANVDPSLYGTCLNKTFKLTVAGQSQSVLAGKLIKKHINENKTIINPMAIFCSPYTRCIETSDLIISTMGFKHKPKTNLLLSEMNFGDQEGCNVENFSQRPIEQYYKEKLGITQYSTQRGENFINAHVRMGLFVIQQHFFNYCPINIIVTHGGPALMLHYFLVQSCPQSEIELKADEYWPTGLVRVYKKIGHNIKYKGILQESNIIKDVF